MITDIGIAPTGSAAAAAAAGVEIHGASDLTAILTEQFQHLLRNADQQRERFERVKAILLAPFQ